MKSSLFLSPAGYILISLIALQRVISAIPVDWTSFKNNSELLNIIGREEWQARDAVMDEPLNVSPVPYVVIHHGGIPKYCYNQTDCSAIVRSYQDLHMDDRGWFDIGYSFVIGEDGNVYEGRGWNATGAHAPGYNTQSIGICVMGDFSDFLPNEAALRTLNALIEYGVSLGKIREDYNVLGHRQARDTLCPGEEFYKYVKLHPRWTDEPVPIYNSTTPTAQPVLNENSVEVSGEA